MSGTPDDLDTPSSPPQPNRRRFLAGGVGLAAAALLSRVPAGAGAQQAGQSAFGDAATDKARLTEKHRRKLGSLEVSSIGLGCMNVAWGFGPPIDRQEAIRLIRTAYDRGVTLFDTAEVYGPFLSEDLVGEPLASVRDRVVIASKFGFDIGPSGEIRGLDSRRKSPGRSCVCPVN